MLRCRVGSWILSPDSSVKNPPASVGDESSAPKGGHGSPPQHASLESPTDRGAWWAAVHEVAESQLLTTGSGGKGLRRHLNGPRSPPHEHFQSKQGPRRKRATSREGHVKSSGKNVRQVLAPVPVREAQSSFVRGSLGPLTAEGAESGT